jgi:hypothetical protein
VSWSGSGQGGLLTRISGAANAPAGGGFSWAQLAGATVFVLVVAVAWRQVTHFIMREI